MSNPDFEVLKSDVETLCNLATKAARKLEGFLEESSLPDDIDDLVARVNRIIANPTDDSHHSENRRMNRDPKSTMED